MTKLTVSNVLFNISTGIYSNVDNYNIVIVISLERLQSGLSEKKYILV